MTLRQRFWKLFYPVLLTADKILKRNVKVLSNVGGARPGQSIFDLSLQLNDGKILSLDQFRGKKVLLVNTASNCAYTAQYSELQKLQQYFGERLAIIAFPSNDFKEQERGSDEEIASFCTTEYQVQFPLAHKSSVVKGKRQNEVFKWLTDKSRNGWNTKQPSWNFSKYLINEEGVLSHYFDPGISPTGHQVIKAIN